jgi:hypothetical protein
MKPISYSPIRDQNKRQQAKRQQELEARRRASSVRPEKKRVRPKPA